MIKIKPGEHTCDYGCDRTAICYFETAKKYCCEYVVNKCIAQKKKLSNNLRTNIYFDAPVQKLNRLLEQKKLNCYICGRTANYVRDNRGCCSEKSIDCPEYKTYMGDNRKQQYKDNPQWGINITKAMKEVHNRPEVVEAKQEAMLKLHHEDCDKCKVFQKNYQDGRDMMIKTMHDRRYYKLLRLGILAGDIPTDREERIKMLRNAEYHVNKKEK